MKENINFIKCLRFQQQQPPFRQVLGMQQQMVGPRGQMGGPRPMAPGNPQNQQFDEVPNYDFLG